MVGKLATLLSTLVTDKLCIWRLLSHQSCQSVKISGASQVWWLTSLISALNRQIEARFTVRDHANLVYTASSGLA